MSILAVNAGSSSLKLSLFDDSAAALLREGSALQEFISDAPNIRVVGHRFVHGGSKFHDPVLVTPEIAAELRQLCDLAPLHNPPAMKAFEDAQVLFPAALQVALFDTAFFSDIPERAFMYPVPYEWLTQWGIRRYGFHGLSHEYCSIRAAEMLRKVGRSVPVEPPQRLITLHLGSGCSASAILDGKPITTSMGFTPMEGLMMATRAGSIDSGILLHLLRTGKLTADQIESALNKSSGLLGVSGISSDYRQVEKAATLGNARAKLALDIYTDSIVSTVGAFTTLLGGIDALVFTGGVGENRSSLRATVCARLSWLGISLGPDRAPDADLATTESRVRVLVIHTRENLMVARAAQNFRRQP